MKGSRPDLTTCELDFAKSVASSSDYLATMASTVTTNPPSIACDAVPPTQITGKRKRSLDPGISSGRDQDVEVNGKSAGQFDNLLLDIYEILKR